MGRNGGGRQHLTKRSSEPLTGANSFDVDGLDPAYAPGTGTPVVGGITTYEAKRLLHGLRGLDIIGGDVLEVSPPFDATGITALAGAQMMFEILCLAAEAFAKRSKK